MSGWPASTLSISRGLDAEAAHLELPVHPPDDLEVAVCQRQRPRSPVRYIRAPGAPPRVGHEPLGGERWAAEVAAGDAAAADVDLALRPGRHRVQVLVENEHVRAPTGLPTGTGRGERPASSSVDLEQGRGDRRLGEPVGVEQPGSGRGSQRRGAVRGVRPVTAGDHEPDASQPLVVWLGEREQLVPVGGGQVDDGDLLRRQVTKQVGRRDRPRRPAASGSLRRSVRRRSARPRCRSRAKPAAAPGRQGKSGTRAIARALPQARRAVADGDGFGLAGGA